MRDPSGSYTYPPGTEGVPDTTISSNKYNTYIADVQQDLNLPRPVVAGGTGAGDAAGARTNLKAEVREQQVTNYDSHAWETGSFWSAVGATGAPEATLAYTGICTRVADDTDDKWCLNAIQRSTGVRYYRQKAAGGAWSAWAIEGADRYVDVTGDTMTGTLTINGGDLALYRSGAPTHGLIQFGNVTGKYLSWDAAKFAFNGGDLVVNSGTLTLGSVSSGLLYFGAGTTRYLAHNGTAFALGGGDLFVNSGTLTLGSATSGLLYYGNTGTKYLAYDGTNFSLVGGHVVISNNGLKPGGGLWADSSDARIKTVSGPYEHGLAELLQVEPVRYTFKGNVTLTDPAKTKAEAAHQAVVGREFIGVIAQDIEGPLPETVAKITGYIDGQQVDDLRLLDASALTYALINAVKELAARVEALETLQQTP